MTKTLENNPVRERYDSLVSHADRLAARVGMAKVIKDFLVSCGASARRSDNEVFVNHANGAIVKITITTLGKGYK